MIDVKVHWSTIIPQEVDSADAAFVEILGKAGIRLPIVLEEKHTGVLVGLMTADEKWRKSCLALIEQIQEYGKIRVWAEA